MFTLILDVIFIIVLIVMCNITFTIMFIVLFIVMFNVVSNVFCYSCLQMFKFTSINAVLNVTQRVRVSKEEPLL